MKEKEVSLSLRQYEQLIEAKVKAQMRNLIAVVLVLVFGGGLGTAIYFAVRNQPDVVVVVEEKDPPPVDTTPPVVTTPPTTAPPVDTAPPEEEPESSSVDCFWVYLISAVVVAALLSLCFVFLPKGKFAAAAVVLLVSGLAFQLITSSIGCGFTGDITPCLAILGLMVLSPAVHFSQYGTGNVPNPATISLHLKRINDESFKKGNLRQGAGRVLELVSKYPILVFLFEFAILTGTLYFSCTSTETGSYIWGVVVAGISMTLAFIKNIAALAKTAADWMWWLLKRVLELLGLAGIGSGLGSGDTSVEEESVEEEEKQNEAVKNKFDEVLRSLKNQVKRIDGPSDEQTQLIQQTEELQKMRDQFVQLSDKYLSLDATRKDAEFYEQFLDNVVETPNLDFELKMQLGSLSYIHDLRLRVFNDDLTAVPELRSTQALISANEAMEGTDYSNLFQGFNQIDGADKFVKGTIQGLQENRGFSPQVAEGIVTTALIGIALRRNLFQKKAADFRFDAMDSEVFKFVKDNTDLKTNEQVKESLEIATREVNLSDEVRKMAFVMSEFLSVAAKTGTSKLPSVEDLNDALESAQQGVSSLSDTAVRAANTINQSEYTDRASAMFEYGKALTVATGTGISEAARRAYKRYNEEREERARRLEESGVEEEPEVVEKSIVPSFFSGLTFRRGRTMEPSSRRRARSKDLSKYFKRLEDAIAKEIASFEKRGRVRFRESDAIDRIKEKAESILRNDGAAEADQVSARKLLNRIDEHRENYHE